MKLSVKLSIVFLIVTVINGCGEVTLSCTTPDVDRAKIDSAPRDDVLENAKRFVRNYIEVKRENELLRKANEVCK